MELCSIEDAFPNVGSGGGPTDNSGKAMREKGSGFPFVGGTDDKGSREERRAARKKAKRCKGPAGRYEEVMREGAPDPDRPAVRRMKAVEAFQSGEEVAADEGATGAAAPVPLAKQPAHIPILPKASCLFSDAGYPSYFGKSEDDPVEESFSSYSAAPGDDPNYRLEPDFTKSFDFQGAQKAAGEALPVPNVNDAWKPMTAATSYTAFTASPSGPPVGAGRGDIEWAMPGGEDVKSLGRRATVLPPPSNPLPITVDGDVIKPAEEMDRAGRQKERDALLARLDGMMARLEELEKKKAQDTQTELLLFVGTGLFLLVSFELVAARR